MSVMQEQPLTIEEFHQEYGVKLKMREEMAWVKSVVIWDNDGESYRAKLYWDSIYGYTFEWVDAPSESLEKVANRPDFEYTIDSYTETELEGNYERA